jgi:hypothetical protein
MYIKKQLLLLLSLSLVFDSCDNKHESKKVEPISTFTKSVQTESTLFTPRVHSTWHWQLQGYINPNLDVDIYNIDLFDSSIDLIKTLHNRGKKVICYISAGTYESWREDSNEFDPKVIGKKMDGWDEQWLNIKAANVKSIMKKRIALARYKKCDAVEVDNVDAFEHDNSFNLSYNDQINYNIFLANTAHKLGLSIGLKNDLSQLKELEPYFDFLINEECHEQKECHKLKSFSQAGKAILNAEYHNRHHIKTICQEAYKLKISTIFANIALNKRTKACK